MKLLLRYIIILFLLNLFSGKLFSQDVSADSIPARLGSTVQKSIYTKEEKKHNSFYEWMWGRHYTELYYKSVTAKAVSLNSLAGGLTVYKQLPKLHSLVLSDNRQNLYLLKPLGGSSSFLESKFFSNVYEQNDFKNTYLNDFIQEAYTIVHPYMFVVSESLAKQAGLDSYTSQIVYMTRGNETDTIADGTQLENKLVSISRLPDLRGKEVLTDVDTLLYKLHEEGNVKIDKQKYIKTRLFDMLTGDWNKVSENWYWVPQQNKDSIVYTAQVVDRTHGFTIVDGVFFKELLNMLGVGFISNYDRRLKNVKKFNDLAYALDIAVTQTVGEDVWIQQAQILKNELTDEIINNAFLKLPEEMQNESTEKIKINLKLRRESLPDIAHRYYIALQKTPVITGTNKNDRFIIDQDELKNTHIRILDATTDQVLFDKKYNEKYTKEIWVYGLQGDDIFEVNKRAKSIPVLVIGGKGVNDYKVENGKNVSIYEYTSEKERLKSLQKAKVIIPNDSTSLDYDYKQLRHTTFSFTPIGIYDSDLGLNLGTSFAYTIYGFRRAPYTRRHQISYDYTNGFTYQGIFPSYDEKKSFHIAAYIGSPAYFSNFFGFGNDTKGYKDENRKYNRVNINKYMLTPALYYNITKDQTVSVAGSFEIYKVKNPGGRNRFINTIYDDDSPIFDTQYYFDLSTTYELNKKSDNFISSFKFLLTGGWTVNLTKPENNFPFVESHIGVNLKITDRLTLATLMKGKAIFSNKYEFYQSATTELRGYRDNRFIGKESFYQYSDVRFDMGKLENPLTPLKYGVFAGMDYGRVWYQNENSNEWHSSVGGGFWLTVLRKFTGKFSYFGSKDGGRFMFELGMGF